VNNLYTDIRSRIPDPPVWFDENAVPRYCAFTPDEAANIYAKEVVLLRVTCQGCDREFDVCMSWGDMDGIRGVERLSKDVAERAIHYGDPPNVDCCPRGPDDEQRPAAGDRVLARGFDGLGCAAVGPRSRAGDRGHPGMGGGPMTPALRSELEGLRKAIGFALARIDEILAVPNDVAKGRTPAAIVTVLERTGREMSPREVFERSRALVAR
jgi:hypothetical protein